MIDSKQRLREYLTEDLAGTGCPGGFRTTG